MCYDCSSRRMFRQFFEEGKFNKIKGEGGGDGKKEKLEKFRMWLKQQYQSVKAEILLTTRSPVLDMQVPAIRTIIEVYHDTTRLRVSMSILTPI